MAESRDGKNMFHRLEMFTLSSVFSLKRAGLIWNMCPMEASVSLFGSVDVVLVSYFFNLLSKEGFFSDPVH